MSEVQHRIYGPYRHYRCLSCFIQPDQGRDVASAGFLPNTTKTPDAPTTGDSATNASEDGSAGRRLSTMLSLKRKARRPEDETPE